MALQPVKKLTHYGIASSAYQVFFKDSIYDTFVGEMISNITNGTPLLISNSKSPQTLLTNCIPGPIIIIITVNGV